MKSQNVFSKVVTLSCSVVALLILLFACYSTRAKADVCSGTRVNITTANFSPYVQLKVAGKEGWFLIDTATNYSTIDPHIFSGITAGSSTDLEIEGFPYIEHAIFTGQEESGYPTFGDERKIGIIGENILSLVSVEFQYDQDSAHIVVSPDACSPKLEGNPEFVEVKETGYYTRDRLRLNPGEFNIPRLYANIGGVNAPVYLDSGDQDGISYRTTGAVTMNNAFISALAKAGILPTLEGRTIGVSCPSPTTTPQDSSKPQWRVSNQRLQITNDEGVVLLQYDDPLLESISSDCTDIASNQSGFGMIGASYFQRWGTVVLDAPAERIWVRKISNNAIPPILPKSDANWCPQNRDTTFLSASGEHYDGRCTDGRYEGHGFLTLQNGDRIAVTFYDGEADGQGEAWFANGDHYKGNFHNGQFLGQGDQWFVDGEHYSGNFLYGHLEGSGEAWLPDGIHYKGNFHDWQFEGQGELWRANGDHYIGNFHAGQSEGQGELWLASGDHYIGNFHDGKSEGQGELWYANGNHYIGNFHNDAPEGYGQTWFADKGYYEGFFHNGEEEGQGTLIWPDKSSYKGSLRGGLSNGHGTYTYPNGDTLEGEWENGKANGYFTRTINGQKFRVLFHDGAEVK